MKRILLCSVWITVLTSSAANAETVNYGELEDLFGEPVTTTATGKPQKSSEAPVALEIITDEQIRRMGVTSLPEVLGRTNGITNWQATRSFSDVGVRGQNTAYNPTLLVLLNGRQVYIDSYGYTDWSLIPVQLEEIRQIEIVKGPTTALYGFNAVSGVVNIVTYNPQYVDIGQAGLVGGTDNYGRAYGIETMKLSDKANLRLSGSFERFDEFDQESETSFAAQSTTQDARNAKFLADSLIQLTDKTQLRLEGSYASADGVDIPTSFSGIPADKSFWSAKTSLVSETSIGQVEANLYTNRFGIRLAGNTPGHVTNQITVAQLQDLFKLGTDHTFRLQGEFRHNTSESGAFFGPGAEISYDAMAAGGMWNWAITPEFEWTNALRVDHLMLDREGAFTSAVPFLSNDEFNQNITDYSINSGIVWKASDMDTVRLSYGRGIQAPSLSHFGADIILAGPAVLAGDPRLEPVVVHNYEIGYDRLLEDIGGKFRGSLFYKRTEDTIALTGTSYVSGITPILQSAAVGDSGTAGVELSLNGTIGSEWKWDAGYIYQNTDDDFTDFVSTNPSPASLHYENTVPHHTLKAHLGYTTGAWEADVYGEVASEFDAVALNGVNYDIVGLDGYYTFGGRLAYTFEDDIVLAIFGSNLTSDAVTDNYGLENERRAFISLSKKF